MMFSNVPPNLGDIELPNCCLKCYNFERFNIGDVADGWCSRFRCHVDFAAVCDDFNILTDYDRGMVGE